MVWSSGKLGARFIAGCPVGLGWILLGVRLGGKGGAVDHFSVAHQKKFAHGYLRCLMFDVPGAERGASVEAFPRRAWERSSLGSGGCFPAHHALLCDLQQVTTVLS
jgi:hypothetical protein